MTAIVRIVAMYGSGLAIGEIARQLHLPCGMVREALAQAGAPLRADKLSIGDLVALYQTPLSLRAIAEQTGMAQSTVQRRLQKAGVTLRLRSQVWRVWHMQLPVTSVTDGEHCRCCEILLVEAGDLGHKAGGMDGLCEDCQERYADGRYEFAAKGLSPANPWITATPSVMEVEL